MYNDFDNLLYTVYLHDCKLTKRHHNMSTESCFFFSEPAVPVALQHAVEEQPFAELAVNKPCSVQQYRNDEEKEVPGPNEDAITFSKNSRKRSRSIPKSIFDSGITVSFNY